MVDIQPQSTQPISDDQELAKVLAGVTDQTDNNDLSFADPVAPATPVATDSSASDLPTPTPTPPSTPDTDTPPIGYNPPASSEDKPTEPADSTPPVTPNPSPTPAASPDVPSMPSSNATESSSDLEGIKKDALNDLRPLVDKLDLEPEEKFDTYLLLLRSTDDKALIPPAHAAAKAIADESRRAKALLDIIKEIDFLSNPQ